MRLNVHGLHGRCSRELNNRRCRFISRSSLELRIGVPESGRGRAVMSVVNVGRWMGWLNARIKVMHGWNLVLHGSVAGWEDVL